MTRHEWYPSKNGSFRSQASGAFDDCLVLRAVNRACRSLGVPGSGKAWVSERKSLALFGPAAGLGPLLRGTAMGFP